MAAGSQVSGPPAGTIWIQEQVSALGAGHHRVLASSCVHRVMTREPQDVTWSISWKGQEWVEYRGWQQ